MKENITYRNARLNDAVKLSVLYKQVYIQTYGINGVSDEFANFITKQFSIERIENTIAKDPNAIVVAEYQGNLVGVAEIERTKKSPVGNIIAPELNKLYILEWFCGKGVGQKLLAFVEDYLAEKGENEIWLWVLESNNRAVNFYEKHQYQYLGNATFQMEKNLYDNKVLLKKLAKPA
jgi:ribosomal protein S18 acetylase RimI-like enzyme